MFFYAKRPTVKGAKQVEDGIAKVEAAVAKVNGDLGARLPLPVAICDGLVNGYAPS